MRKTQIEMFEHSHSSKIQVTIDADKKQWDEVLDSKEWSVVANVLGGYEEPSRIRRFSDVEQESLMWKHTAKVYEQRYENMQALMRVSTTVTTASTLISAVLGLILILQLLI